MALGVAMLNRLTHQALQLACRRSDNAFRGQNQDLQAVQQQKLAKILAQVAVAKGQVKSLLSHNASYKKSLI
jgi:hypothetical protein